MMQEWCTAQELANLGLTDFPATKRGVNLYLGTLNGDTTTEKTRRRAGRGGGYEYHYTLLPQHARLDYLRRQLNISEKQQQAEEAVALEGVENLSAPATENRDAKIALVVKADEFFEANSLNRQASDKCFSRLYCDGVIEAPDWIRLQVKSLSARSLARWRKAISTGKASSLAVDRGAARKGKGILNLAENGDVETAILGHLINRPHLSAWHIRDLIRSEFGDVLTLPDGTKKPVPNIRTVQAFLKGLKETYKAQLVAATNPDKWRGSYRAAGKGSLRWVTRPNQLWQIDASPADVMLADGRHTIYATVDIATRRLMIYVSKTPRAEAVAMLLRRTILEWGIPDEIKTDNGSDFTAKSIDRLFYSLGIEKSVSPAYTPEDKGHVERAIRTFQHDLAALMPGFIGHNVSQRKVIEERKSFAERLGSEDAALFGVSVTAQKLQNQADDWCRNRYAQRPHAGLDGVSPFEAEAKANYERRVVDPRALDMLIAPIASNGGCRTVTKHGVRIDGYHYLSGGVLPGTNVLVRKDPNDLGLAFLFTQDGHDYLGEAVCAELAGIDPAEALRAAKEHQRQVVQESTAEARKAAKRYAKENLAELVMDVARRDASNVVSFPKCERPHETPSIAAAGEAATPVQRAAPASDPGAAWRELQAGLGNTKSPETPSADNVMRLPENGRDRYRRAREFEEMMASGEALSAEDAHWLGSYQTSSEYRGFRNMEEDMGWDPLAPKKNPPEAGQVKS